MTAAADAIAAVAAATLAAATVAGSAIAQVATNDNLSPWVSGGSATLAVAALAYVARKLTSGDLVARDTAATLVKLEAVVAGYEATTERLADLVGEGLERERRLLEYLEHRHDGSADVPDTYRRHRHE